MFCLLGWRPTTCFCAKGYLGSRFQSMEIPRGEGEQAPARRNLRPNNLTNFGFMFRSMNWRPYCVSERRGKNNSVPFQGHNMGRAVVKVSWGWWISDQGPLVEKQQQVCGTKPKWKSLSSCFGAHLHALRFSRWYLQGGYLVKDYTWGSQVRWKLVS